MALFDSIFKPDTGPTTQYANKASKDINIGKQQAIGDLKTGLGKAAPQYEQAADIYGGFGQQFQPGVDMYLNSLGLNGAAGNTAALGAFQNGPGYEAALNASQEALNRQGAARGNWNSGNIGIALLDDARNKQNLEYGSWQDRLAGLINPSYSGLSGQAQTLRGLGDLIRGNYEDRANVRTGAASNQAGINLNTGANLQAANNAGTENFWNAILGGLNAAGKVAGAFA